MLQWILAIADDLTGALETGSRFTEHGIRACVTTRSDAGPAPQDSVLVIDTETRHLPSAEAGEVVRKIAASASDPWLVYKKTDSTLRGNIAAELSGICRAMPERQVIYAPAYPALGRTVQSGRLFINGIPLHETEFARDRLNPVLTSDIGTILGDLRATVVDGEVDEDVVRAAQQIVAQNRTGIGAGPAALAGALAKCISTQPALQKDWPNVQRCLVVNGSLHPASAAQIAYAKTHSCFSNGWSLLECDPGGVGLARAHRLGQHVSEVLRSSSFDALIIFGGDTAFGIHRALGHPDFEPQGEILTGVPVSHAGGMFWITKAGGFGAPDLLCELRKRLT